ncbi:MAG: flagellar protein FlaG [Caldimicrobium sp.]
MKVEIFKNLALDQAFAQSVSQNKNIKNIETQRMTQEGFNKSEVEKINEKQLREISDELSKFLNQFDLLAKVVYDKKYETLVVQVMRKDTMQIIKQIPPEELLELSKRLQELVGILLQDKA